MLRRCLNCNRLVSIVSSKLAGIDVPFLNEVVKRKRFLPGLLSMGSARRKVPLWFMHRTR
jgi:hypothetical protein